jgi:hypothetical protein
VELCDGEQDEQRSRRVAEPPLHSTVQHGETNGIRSGERKSDCKSCKHEEVRTREGRRTDQLEVELGVEITKERGGMNDGRRQPR